MDQFHTDLVGAYINVEFDFLDNSYMPSYLSDYPRVVRSEEDVVASAMIEVQMEDILGSVVA